MTVIQVVVLAIIQGLAELLPVSSSAHVVVAEKLMGLDPTTPALTLLLVLLHTGTMCAVVAYFWRSWMTHYFASRAAFGRFAVTVVIATAITGVISELVAWALEKAILRPGQAAQVEELFGHLELIAPALFAGGVLIVASYLIERRRASRTELGVRQSALIGAVQGLCLPFRGFSRSGATISTALILGVEKATAEAFSFALAVILTPPVVVREVLRLRSVRDSLPPSQMHSAVSLSILGGALAFLAGLVALRWISAWLERGRWYYFGIYCMLAGAAVALLHAHGL